MTALSHSPEVKPRVYSDGLGLVTQHSRAV